MSYTTVTAVRREAGFTGNTNVADDVIQEKIRMVEGFINGYVGDLYTLPLDTFYRQTLTFSGTGTGAGTLTFTIDALVYNVTIALALTAAQAADRFRVAADVATNTSFVTDGIGAGTLVTMNTRVINDSADVTITANNSPQGGVTATAGLQVFRVAPPLIEQLATQLAAAFLLIEEYGPEAQDTDKDGQKKVDFLVKNVLEKIKSKELKVYNFIGVEIATNSLYSPSFLPSAATSDEDAEDSTFARFTMNRTF